MKNNTAILKNDIPPLQTHHKTGAIYVALSGLFFGFIGYFGISIVHAHFSVNTMLFWRFLVASVTMCIVILPYISQLQTRLAPLCWAFIYGLFFYGPSSTLYFVAADSIGSGLSMVLFYTFPAMVLLMEFFITKKRVSVLYCMAVGIILVGMIGLTLGDQGQLNAYGFSLSILSALLFALYMMLSKSSTAPALLDTLMVCLGATVSSLLLALLEHRFDVPDDAVVWLNILGIGTLCTAIPILLLLKGLKNISALQASILSVLEPVFVICVGVSLLGEIITVSELIGIIILLSGALLALVSY